MKFFAPILAGLLLACTCFAAPPKTEEEFLAAVRAAFEAKSVKKIHALTWEKGLSAADKEQMTQMLAKSLKNNGEIDQVGFIPLPASFKSSQVAYGKKFEPSHPPQGLVAVVYKPKGDHKQVQSLGFAVVDGVFYLITGKTTDLGWKGPSDRTFTITVTGEGSAHAKLFVKYNASGVDIEEAMLPHAFPCQYISEATVTTDDPAAEITLTIVDGKKTIFQSEPLKGVGQVAYKRPKSK